MFKKGDKVTLHDCSYHFGIDGGEFSHNLRSEWENVLQVVTTGLKVANIEGYHEPQLDLDDEYCIVCDILITNGKGGFWFTQSRFLKHVEPEIEIILKVNGKESKLSDISEETLLRIRNQT